MHFLEGLSQRFRVKTKRNYIISKEYKLFWYVVTLSSTFNNPTSVASAAVPPTQCQWTSTPMLSYRCSSPTCRRSLMERRITSSGNTACSEMSSESGFISTNQTHASNISARSYQLKHTTRMTYYLRKIAAGIMSSTCNTRIRIGTITSTEFYQSMNSTS